MRESHSFNFIQIFFKPEKIILKLTVNTISDKFLQKAIKNIL